MQIPPRASDATDKRERYWWLILLFVVFGLALRLYQLLMPGHLFGLTEYDDGVYFGAALRLTEGYLPYKNFVMVQPPGIAVLLFPVAMLSHWIGASNGLAVARCLTLVVDAANIVLVGLLAKPKGKFALMAACSVMALYPAAIASSQTVLLEPYLNLFCLIGVWFLFRRGDLNESTSALIWGGIFIGIAGSVKAWAVLPALAALLVILWLTRRIYCGTLFFIGTIGGFAAMALPFIWASPGSFLNEVLLVQLGRSARQRVGLMSRLDQISGASSIANVTGHASWVSAAIAVTLVVAVLLALKVGSWKPVAIDYFAMSSLIIVFLALLWPSDFYYHYPDFLVPFIALVVAFLGKTFAAPKEDNRQAVQRGFIRTFYIVVVLGFSFVQVVSESMVGPAPLPAAFASSVIPPGACVVGDEVALMIEADRFISTKSGCPIAIDAFGTALTFSNGRTVDAGASGVPKVRSFWMMEMKAAQFVWLSPQNRRRLPWSRSTSAYFGTHFRLVATSHDGLGEVYKARAVPIKGG